MTKKVIIVTAPSGAGKTTIVKHLLSRVPKLAFSVSATTRRRRPGEVDGIDYYFTNEEDFKDRITKHEFIEWEEVYHNTFYGTLQLEVDRLWQMGKAVIFDVDVKGAVNLKKKFGEQALSLFIKPPSELVLEERLINRNTEDWLCEIPTDFVNTNAQTSHFVVINACMVSNGEVSFGYIDNGTRNAQNALNNFLELDPKNGKMEDDYNSGLISSGLSDKFIVTEVRKNTKQK